jgi:hypothetical protein
VSVTAVMVVFNHIFQYSVFVTIFVLNNVSYIVYRSTDVVFLGVKAAGA